MTIDEMKAADEILISVQNIASGIIAILDGDPPADDTCIGWDNLWPKLREQAQGDLHDALQRRLDLVRCFSACAILAKKSATEAQS